MFTTSYFPIKQSDVLLNFSNKTLFELIILIIPTLHKMITYIAVLFDKFICGQLCGKITLIFPDTQVSFDTSSIDDIKIIDRDTFITKCVHQDLKIWNINTLMCQTVLSNISAFLIKPSYLITAKDTIININTIQLRGHIRCIVVLSHYTDNHITSGQKMEQ